MKFIAELLKLSESKGKLYLPEPYGSGLHPEPVRAGEVIIDNDGDEYEFCGISGCGKMIRLKKGGKGEEIVKKPSFVSGVIKEGKQPGKITEPGWYVCDADGGPIDGPMAERDAKEVAEGHGKGYTAEYFTDYEIRRMNEGLLVEGKTKDVARIYGEVMSALGKSAPNLSAAAKKAIKDAIEDAYDAGEDAGHEAAMNEEVRLGVKTGRTANDNSDELARPTSQQQRNDLAKAAKANRAVNRQAAARKPDSAVRQKLARGAASASLNYDDDDASKGQRTVGASKVKRDIDDAGSFKSMPARR